MRLPYKMGDAASENVESSHQFLTRFHRLCWIHSAEHFFPTLTIHCRKFAHPLIARFPFCVFARADAECEQRRCNPNGNVSCGDEEHKCREPSVKRSPFITKFKRACGEHRRLARPFDVRLPAIERPPVI